MMKSLVAVYASAALVSGVTMNPPPGFVQICKGEENIIQWIDVPHDWNYEFEKNNGCCSPDPKYPGQDIPLRPNCCEGDRNPKGVMYKNKDWWYWGDDWQQRIANGDLNSEPIGSGTCNNNAWALGNTITFCDPSDPSCPSEDANGEPITIEDKCRKACAFEYSTEGDIRQRCNYFSFNESTRQCKLYSRCAWPLTANGMQSHRVKNIHPAGFKSFDLREFNEPPVCIWVPGSGDKKVEVMIETEMNDASICIRDGSDMGVGRNADVGNVETCNDGKLEACFTAATVEKESEEDADDEEVGKDFFFMIYCKGSCEASDIDLWLRIRTSRIDWNAGKTNTGDDIEMWCEMEKGSTSKQIVNGVEVTREEYTWPSDLLPKKPSKDPYNIKHTNWMSAAPSVSVSLAVVLSAVLSALALV